MRIDAKTLTRLRKSKWFKLVWLLPAALVLLLIAVLLAKVFHGLPWVQSFMKEFPGTSALPSGAPVGIPGWLGWQHFLNAFLILFIIRAGWQIRAGHPRLSTHYWTRRARRGAGRVSGTPPVRIGLAVWWHLVVNALWILNGVVFFVLIFSTGQWTRLVPFSWDVVPNSISVAIQYLSLDWPTESGWVNYNSLQLIAYFITVFIAAPLSVVTGLRMTPGLSERLGRLGSVFTVQFARFLHFWLMVWFVMFIVVHVTLVLATGVLRNLNHMYASRNDDSWVGLWIFAASLVVIVIGWVATTPAAIRYLGSLSGSISR